MLPTSFLKKDSMPCAFTRRYSTLRMFFPLRFFTLLLLNSIQIHFCSMKLIKMKERRWKKIKENHLWNWFGLEIEECVFCTRNKTKLAFSIFSSPTEPVIVIPGIIWDACSLQIYATGLNFLSQNPTVVEGELSTWKIR